MALTMLGGLSILLSGCGESGSNASAVNDPSAKFPSCAHAGKPVALPSGFPSSFPFPSGTRIVSGTAEFGGIVIQGVIPTDFSTTVQYYVNSLPKSGYNIRDSESEPPYDAESFYSGNGYIGRWHVRYIINCPGAMLLTAYGLAHKGTV